jgi:5-methylcytosine-specific restriction enzyme subunit McrC
LAARVDLPRSAVDALAAHPDRPVQLAPCPGGWLVTPGSLVGVVRVPGAEFHIRPKIGLRNVFLLMEVADTPLNRLVAAGLRRAGVVPDLPVRERRLLRRHLAHYDEVTGAPSAGWLDRWTPTRLDRHWVPAARLADLLLRRLSVADRAGTSTGTSFLVDMNQLFERFVTDRLRRLLRGRLEVVDRFSTHLDVARRLPIRPDLVFRHQEEPVFVADCKYKLAQGGEARMSDYYQALSYATALGLGDAALISHVDPADPLTDLPPALVRHAGTRLHSWPIDLRGDPVDIDRSMLTLADRVHDVVARGSAHRDSRRGRVSHGHPEEALADGPVP